MHNFILLVLLAVSCGKSLNNDLFIPEDSNPSAAAQKEEAVWSDEVVSEGMIYHKMIGYEPITAAQQIIHVLEVDLNNPRYKVRLFHQRQESRVEKTAITTADAVEETGAVAGINGGYAVMDVFAKVDGIIIDEQMRAEAATGIPQWKNEGAMYLNTDKESGKSLVEIRFDGRGMNVDQQRAFYRAQPDENIISSAPMLIESGDPVGERFVDPPLTVADAMKLGYEDPRRHQTQWHPRTAVAMTRDNHILLVVVDGRRTNVAEGINAADLTRFLVKHFDPLSALNLDGGGSSTMVVKGSKSASPSNYVVNYPSASDYLDHTHLRQVPTHILIVDAQK